MKDLHALPKPLVAFAVDPGGQAQPLTLPEDGSLPDVASGYVWLHFDLNDPLLKPWLDAVAPEIPATALLQSETRPRADVVENDLILQLRGVNLNPGQDPDDMVSVRLWVQERLIVSARKRKVLAVDAIRQRLASGTGPTTVSAFLADLTYGLTKRIEEVSLDLVEATDALEESALHPNRETAADLADLRQSVIKLRRFVRPQCAAIVDLADGSLWPLEPTQASLLNETANRATRLLEEFDATADRLKALQEYMDMVQNSVLGRNSYVLSVVAAIFLPLGFLTGLLGVNVGGIPGVDAPYGFAVVTIGSAVIGLILFFVFRALKWL